MERQRDGGREASLVGYEGYSANAQVQAEKGGAREVEVLWNENENKSECECENENAGLKHAVRG